MSRRALTPLLASSLTLVLVGGASVVRVPYVALGPGPTYNTLGEVDGTPVLAIEGRPTYSAEGHLDLTTVGVDDELTLTQALQGWFDRDTAVVPREVVFPPDLSEDEADRKNVAAFTASQATATTAAARQLGLRTAEVRVREVPSGSPSQGRLRVGDVLTAVDGRALRDAAELRSLIAGATIGDGVRIDFVRDGAAGTVEIRTGASDDGGAPRPVIGVVTEEKPLDAPFEVTVTAKGPDGRPVGGPSAGLMFALGILDKLEEGSLTGGAYVAGTGTIAPDGTVGRIGGISQKLVAAADKGAEAFLVPDGNCAEALTGAPEGLVLASVSSLSEALTALEALRRGERPEPCAA